MITKIQSFTDVITNSSSTVFVMHEDDSRYYERLENAEGCIDVQPITMEWLQENVYEFEMVLDLLNIPCSEITTYHKFKDWGWLLENSRPNYMGIFPRITQRTNRRSIPRLVLG